MYTVDASVDEPIMMIDRHIGYDDEDGYGIDGPGFARELLALDSMNKKRIQVWINSPGGTVVDGMDIYNAFLRSKTPVDTYCMGIAASIAGVIFQGGRNRIMADYGVLMYHNPFGDATDAAVTAMKNALTTMISERCKMTTEQVSDMMNSTTYLNANEAKRMGLCDTIQGSSDFNKKRLNAAEVTNSAKSYWKEAGAILNNIFKTEPNMAENVSLVRICNRLKLNQYATEDAILEALTSIENKVREAENALAAANVRINGLETEKANLTGVVNTLKVEKEAAEKTAKKSEATALVEAAAKLGKIKNEAEVKAKWIDRAIADYDGTKELLESVGVNKVANKIVLPTGAQADDSALDNAVAVEMAKIRNRVAKQHATQAAAE